jgi:hypothetical protein
MCKSYVESLITFSIEDAERCRSGAAGSGSEARAYAGSRRLQRFVRPWTMLTCMRGSITTSLDPSVTFNTLSEA